MDVSRQAVSLWESGAALPDAPNLLKLSRIFSVSIDYLLRDEFESDRDLPAVKENDRRLKKFYRDRLTVGSGWCLLALSGLGFGALAIGTVISPADVIDSEGNHYSGLWGFLKYHDLEWAYYLTLVLLISGLLAVLWPWVRELVKKWLYAKKPKEGTARQRREDS